MKKVKSGIVCKTVVTFVITMLALVFLLFLSWTIPDKMVKYNVSYSLDFVSGEWVPIFTYANASCLDNVSDEVYMNNVIKEGGNEDYNLFESMLDVKGYARYWHGNLLVLRPLFCFFNYLQIRYINMFLLMLLVSMVFTKIKERLGWGIAISFMIAMCMSYVIIIPWSLHFSPVYYIMLLFIFFILLFYFRERKPNKDIWLLSFLIIGIFTNFFDGLSAPLLTLGMPLSIITLIDLKHKDRREIAVDDVLLCFYWGMGYALCWISKWVLASLVLHKNVLFDAVKQAGLRVTGGEETVIDAIEKNLAGLKMPYLSDTVEKWYGALAVILVLLILMSIMFIFRKKETKFPYPLMILTLLPYAWMCVFKGHSYIHFIFTYRIQMISIFCLLCIYVDYIDWGCFAHDISQLFRKRGRE